MRWALLVLLLASCGNHSERPEPQPAPEREPEPEPEPERTERDETARHERSERTPLTAEQCATLRRARREARAATRAGNLTEARSRFDEALAIAPDDPRLHCEAGFALLEGDADALSYSRAHLATGLALFGPGDPPESLREPLAMCLYNHGLLAQREGQLTRAERHFERSLALRDNAAVRRHLDAARRGEPLPPLSTTSAEAYVARLNAEAEVDGEAYSEGDEPPYSLVRVIPRADDHPEVAIVRSTWYGGLEGALSVAIRTPSGYHRRHLVETMRRPNAPMDAAAAGLGEIRFPIPGWAQIELNESFFTYYEDSFEDEEEDRSCHDQWSFEGEVARVAMCRLEAPPACRVLVLERTIEPECIRVCYGDDGDRGRNVECEVDHDDRPDFHLSLSLDPERGVRLSGSDPRERPPVPVGRWVPWSEVLEPR